MRTLEDRYTLAFCIIDRSSDVSSEEAFSTIITSCIGIVLERRLPMHWRVKWALL